MFDEREPAQVFVVAGKEFRIFDEYYEPMQASYPHYPDFVANPEYTSEGRPFAHFIQEGCSNGSDLDGEAMMPENCGSCRFFRRELNEIPVGVCMSEGRRQGVVA